jgi:hypothetical protein
VSRIALSGQGAVGTVTGWPTAPLDFGPADCGGKGASAKSFTLQNSGTVDAHIISSTLTGASFNTTGYVGTAIPAGGVLTIVARAPAVPSPSPLTPITATLAIKTDADDDTHVVTLTEHPRGAVLAVDTSATPSFGDFGPVVLLRSASQPFTIKNQGNGSADVTVATTGPFQAATPTFTLPATQSQSNTVTFAPVAANGANGTLALVTKSPVCAVVPAPLALTGTGVGGGPTVAPTTLLFGAPCGLGTPAPQSFTIRNDGQANMTWTAPVLTGPGASRYSVAIDPPPGLLTPGSSSVITVTAQAVPSPTPDPSPDAYEAQLVIDTDVPLDPHHVVGLHTVPLGDQLSFSIDGVRFGQLPIATSMTQSFTVLNHANTGTAAANLALVVGGASASAYAVAPGTAANLAPGAASSSQVVTFAPPSPAPYPATIAIQTSDPLCTALPAPLAVSGTGTAGRVLASTSSLAFGTDTGDPAGYVACGATGPTQSFTVSNVGNQVVHVTNLALGKGGSSPFTASTSSSLPVSLPINGGIVVLVAPKPVPTATDPNDANAFNDTLTITTDAANDPPHVVSLAMRARGAVIADGPLVTTWAFGTVGFGSASTVTNVVKNTGNLPASVTLGGLAQPAIFGLRPDPTVVPGGATVSLVAQFTPSSSNGAWADKGTIAITAEAFCAPLPAAWNAPAITMSGASSGTPPVTLAGSLAFPASSCGDGPPAPQSVTITNATDRDQAYTAAFQSGAFYTFAGASSGTLPANGSASIAVAPRAVTPGPGVVPGSAPYADGLVLTIATKPPTTLTVPISAAWNGAVLSLPQGAGSRTDDSGPYYPADDASGFHLAIDNSGTAAASVSFAIAPSNAATIAPSTPVEVLPGLGALPALSSGPGAPACPSTASATVTFFYSGPVCQPLPVSSVEVHSCSGAMP